MGKLYICLPNGITVFAEMSERLDVGFITINYYYNIYLFWYF